MLFTKSIKRMPWGLLMLTAHYLCHRDSQGWTLSTLFQKQSLKQSTVMSNLTGTQSSPLETRLRPHCLCNLMLAHHPPWSSWEKARSTDNIARVSWCEGSENNDGILFLFVLWKRYTDCIFWSFQLCSECSYRKVQTGKLRICGMFLEVLMAF